MSCGGDNREGARFCSGCGAELAAACSSCGAKLTAGAAFCDNCGASVTATARSPSASPPTPTPAPTPALPSSFASDRYTVHGFLGEGGRKRVYLAHDTKLDRDVAVAVIKTEGLDAEGLVRVRREAQAMGRLGDHAHVVVVHDVGEDEGQPYIVSRYMAGGSVEEQLAKAEGHRLPIHQAIRTAEQVSLALDHAHKNGIIHRDLKPGNVWLTAEGTAMLGDFGLAMALDRSRMTAHGMMVGTVAYMPPEQALGRAPDARSDLYSLGAMLYEMVTGRPPFLGDDAVGVISQHINTAPIDPSWHNPEVRGALEDLILHLLAKSPADRPETASAVAVELRRIIAAGAQAAPQEPVQEAATAGRQAGIWGRFVGRRDEMEQLKAALEGMLSGHGSLVMLVGEPGIGKSRLAREFTVYASLRGAQVLTGHCYEGEITVPYLPFVEALRQYVRGRSDAALLSELGSGAPEVAKLVSEVRERFPDLPEAPPLEGEAERLRLFDSVTRFVCSVSTSEPVVLFLDDIHWADKPSLLLLQYLARNVRSDRILVLAAYRDVELDRTHPLSEVLASLRRERLFERVLLRGLPSEDVLAMISAIGQQSAGPEQYVNPALSNAVYEHTEGNPFFIEEVLLHLTEVGALYRKEGQWQIRMSALAEHIPEGVREVIGRRLSRLSEPCNRMLSLASIMTGGFSFDLLLAVNGEEEGQLLDLLDEALRALVIRERSGADSGVYEFNHALMRQTLYSELNTPRRVRVHRQVGEAMERVYAANLEPHLPALAHHFFQAAPGGDVDKAIDYATRAAERALSLTAYEEAAGLYDLALQALELKDRADDVQLFDLSLALGEARNSAGDRERAKESFQRAATVARHLNDAQRLAGAALGFAGPFGAFGSADQPTADILEEALHALGEDDSGRRAKVLARLGLERWFADRRDEGNELTLAGLEVARRVGDSETIAVVLFARSVSLWSGELSERLALYEELIARGQESGDTERLLLGRFGRVTVLLEACDIRESDLEMESYAAAAERFRQPRYVGWVRAGQAMRALLDGRFEDAERLIEEVSLLADRSQDEFMSQMQPTILWELRREQDRVAEVEQEVMEVLDQWADTPLGTVGRSVLYHDLGREIEARTEFEAAAADGFAAVLSSGAWMQSLIWLSSVCAALRDAARAAVLYELLLPYAERNMILGPTTTCLGVTSRYLGLLATTMSRWEDAERHFQHALDMNARIGARPILAWTQCQYADMLVRRDERGDREKALSLLAEALDTAQELGMKLLTERALALKLKAQGIEGSDLLTSIDTVAKEVLAVQPDLRPHAAPDGTVTIMFSDIEGSTAMADRLGDARFMEVLREHNAIIRERIKAHGGFEVKSEGDGFMVAFQSARKALACASGVQRALVQRNQSAAEPVLVRVGLHAGEVIKEGEDFFGRNVIMAARVAAQAQGGEILASAVVKALVAGSDVTWGEFRTVELKGLSGDHEIWPVNWSE